jgi:type IV pilus assembly protein PilC
MATVAKAWSYRGTNPDGKSVTGRVDARNEAAVATRLRAMGISPSAISEAGTGFNRDINLGFLERGVKVKDLAVMSRQMATMIGAGVSLLRTLTILTDQTENKKLAETLDAVRTDVETGRSLSDAMSEHPIVFPPLFLNLIRAGETGGFLEDSLESVAGNYEAEVKLRGTIKAALTYPVVVLIIAICAVIAMLTFVVPVFQQMFAQFGAELPLPTQILVSLSHAMIWIGPLLVIVTVAAVIWWGKNKNLERTRRVVDPLLLRLPVFGLLLKKVAIARFSRTFATMMGAGVPILRALSIVGTTSGNYVIENALLKVQDSVRHGRSIAAPLAEEPVFPAMVTQMISVGEDSGALEQMLTKISEFYDQEVEATTKQLTALIEPIMIAVIGTIIGGMIVALYLPMFDIYSHIK